ncbi:MAG: flagellar hook capping protein [Rhodospirillaceae bacterium]|jgi:flagellar basal-body rod modification protein FlgD|nr:flagellar hook capping protein [Rhodospirillaceae bacterium]MDP6926129.1 flagellar hook capping FlgD N-terminal domain-containing protein [Rhodospirillales bacterium]|tara:strand:- start:804 stop:1466 length:663 start_codon:yes stop_codon:yes gene_type:complete
MIDAVTSANTSKADTAGSTLAGDLDSFLLLLTTQLQHQDPLSPLEPTEFTGQLVQFASVEQSIATNKHMEDLLSVQNASLASSVVGFIGTSVEAEINNLPVQNGTAEFTYTLSDNAKNVVIAIMDDKGNIKHTKAGELAAGEHNYTWDGKDANGVQVTDGAYIVSVTPIGFTDEPVAVKTIIKANITGVNMESGSTMLDANGVAIPLDKVLTVNEKISSP